MAITGVGSLLTTAGSWTLRTGSATSTAFAACDSDVALAGITAAAAAVLLPAVATAGALPPPQAAKAVIPARDHASRGPMKCREASKSMSDPNKSGEEDPVRDGDVTNDQGHNESRRNDFTSKNVAQP